MSHSILQSVLRCHSTACVCVGVFTVHAWYLLAPCCPFWENLPPYLAVAPLLVFGEKDLSDIWPWADCPTVHCTTDVDNIAYSQTGGRQCCLNRRNGSLFQRPIFEFKPVLFYPMFTFHPHLTTPWFAQTGREPFIPIYGDKFATLVRFLSFATFVKEKVAWRGTPVIFYCTIDLPRILYGLLKTKTWLSLKWTDGNFQAAQCKIKYN